MTKKDIASILYMYYIDKFLEDDFSFDKGKTREKVKSHYDKLRSEHGDEVDEIRNNINVSEDEGTDYDVMYFSYDKCPEVILQVTSMIDYDGNSPEGYTGDSDWCDVGLFMVDYNVVDFDDLDKG